MKKDLTRKNMRKFKLCRFLHLFLVILIVRMLVSTLMQNKTARQLTSQSLEESEFHYKDEQYFDKFKVQSRRTLHDREMGDSKLRKNLYQHPQKQSLDSESTPSKCFEPRIDWEDGTEPKYKMNPELLLIPALYNGPNNQMNGFHQSVLVALLLNRTLVLPQFYEHAFLGVTFRGLVNAKYRLDVQKLRRFISIIPLKKAVGDCNGKLDAIFSTGGWNKKAASTLVRIHIEFGLRGVRYRDDINNDSLEMLKRYVYFNEDASDDFKKSHAWWPVDRNDESWIEKILHPDVPMFLPVYPREKNRPIKIENLKELYKSDEKCSLYWYPFRQFHFKPTSKDISDSFLPGNLENVTMENGGKLYMEILRNLQSPPSMKEFAKEFQINYLTVGDSDYLAVHWRFDQEDFYNYLCEIKKSNARSEFCNAIKKAANATAIAAAILQKLHEASKMGKKDFRHVYFAAPPTVASFVDEVRSEIQRLGQLQHPTIYTAKELKTFLFEKYRQCESSQEERLSDTISQIEMELCTHSGSFLWSRQSTWSQNVLLNRYGAKGRVQRRMDDSITDYTLKLMKINS